MSKRKLRKSQRFGDYGHPHLTFLKDKYQYYNGQKDRYGEQVVFWGQIFVVFQPKMGEMLKSFVLLSINLTKFVILSGKNCQIFNVTKFIHKIFN